MIPVIISGGAGSRLWPVSRQFDPKPFIKLSDGLSLLQTTFMRAIQLKNVEKVLTVTSEKVFFRMYDEYQQINRAIVCDFILEPFGRNTASAILASCLLIADLYGINENILILPADHLITNFDAFSQIVEQAEKIAEDGYLVTFGITPEYPEIGYGYVESDTSVRIHDGYLVKRFVEKPGIDVAREYVSSGNYLWNSGMFFGKVETFLREFETCSPKLFLDVKNCINSSQTKIDNYLSHIIHLNEQLFKNVENISIDYALFEKSNKTAVIPCSINWSDIGSWLSVSGVLPKDDDGNVVVGESISHNTTDCLLYSTNRMIATVDIDNLIIVDTPDALLVADKNNSQNVKHIFERLKLTKSSLSERHTTVHYKWGVNTVLEQTLSQKINMINLKPGCEFILQSGDEKTEECIELSKQYSFHFLIVFKGELTVKHGVTKEIIGINTPKTIIIDKLGVEVEYLISNTTDSDVVFLEIQNAQVS